VSDPDYALGRSDSEHERLLEQASFIRPITERLFHAAGIRSGMRVLDVGSGVGDVAFLASELVGPQGEVVGIDLDATALEKARSRAERLGLSNVRFVRGDIRTAGLQGCFDAAVGRLVLMYFADPGDGLRAVAARVRTGGAIVFQEMDMDPGTTSRAYPAGDTLWNMVGLTIIKTFEAAGVHTRMGRKLLDAYGAAGLGVPSLLEETVVGGGPNFAGYSWLANTLRSLAPMAEKLGIANISDLGLDSLAARLRDEAVAQNLMVWSPPYVGAFTAKP
jgi:SAM-dependent methyltransferase